MTEKSTAKRIQKLAILVALSLSASTGMAVTTVEVGTPYSDPGATAYDAFEGDLTSLVVSSNNVDTYTLGAYTVTYEVSDASGNAANPVVRTVLVVDTTAPAIALAGEQSVTVDAGTAYVDAGATASDNYDGDLSGQIVTTNPVDTAVPGTYTVTYTVSDASGNTAVKTRNVDVAGETGTVTIASPLHGSIFYVPNGQAVAPVTMTAHVDCTVEYIEYRLDGTPVGMAFEAPYAVTANLDVASFGLGQHELAATARVAATQQDVTANSVFTVEAIAEQDDADANGIPDNPYQSLAVDGDTWVQAVNVTKAAATVTIGATRFEGSGSVAPQDVPVVMGLDGRVSVSVPRELLQSGESGVAIVAVSEDLESLFGIDETALLGAQPAGYILAEGGRYVQVSVIVSADGGASFQDLDDARLATNPVHLSLQGLAARTPQPGQRADFATRGLFAHDTFIDSDPVTGLFFAALDGDWYDTGATAGHDVMSADLTSLSAVVAPYDLNPDAPEIIIGDVNCDGAIDRNDTEIIRHLVFWGEEELNAHLLEQGLEPVNPALADVDLDGKIDKWDRKLHDTTVKQGIEYVNEYLTSHGKPLCHIGESLYQ